jgi:sulfite reductase beta subunit-like hemoprotein
MRLCGTYAEREFYVRVDIKRDALSGEDVRKLAGTSEKWKRGINGEV